MYTVLKGGTLIDGSGKVFKNHALVFKDKYIHAIAEQGEPSLPRDALYYKTEGRYIIPGFIDAHIHLDLHGMPDAFHESLVEDKLRTIRATREMANTIRAGVTTVRNAGSTNFIDIAVKRAVDEGLVVGPRILASGRIICMMTAGNEYFKGLYREADGVDENRKAAREQLKQHADVLKVMATGAIMNPGGMPDAAHLDIEEIRAVVEEASKMGKHTAAHAHGAQGIKNAVKAGVRTIEHGTLADEEALRMIADNGVFLVSTLCSNYWMIRGAEKIGLPAFMYDKAEEIAKIRKDNLHRAIDMGVKVVMGTDAGTPYNYHGRNCMEIVQYVKQGLMSEMEAIKASTQRAAEAIGLKDRTGTLEKGKLADCVVLNSNPLENIDSLLDAENVSMVFKEGKMIEGKVDTDQWSPNTRLGIT